MKNITDDVDALGQVELQYSTQQGAKQVTDKLTRAGQWGGEEDLAGCTSG